MIFTSYTYGAFLLLALFIHWSLPQRARRGFLILASYLFYCSWQWQFGFLLLGVSLFNWAWGRWRVGPAPTTANLATGIAVNLIPLVYFKYWGFLLENVDRSLRLAGFEGLGPVAQLALPLGISFFTFQGVAYLVDVATGEAPFRSLRDFLLFKAFWPQLIAGPIIRPGEIHDQIETPRPLEAEDLSAGLQRILEGAFKKVVLADTLAPYVDAVFLPAARPGVVDVIAGTVGFGLQIYFDFSGYSDIAIGSARLFGFRFPENFAAPYLSRSPQEFWNRWHMTLSRWIRDYVFAPLAFQARGRKSLSLFWLVTAMAICGLWHGAQWTFVAWGVWHGLLLVAGQTVLLPLVRPARPGERAAALRTLAAVAFTDTLVLVGWVFFRAENLAQVSEFAQAVVTLRGGMRPLILRENGLLLIALIFAFMLLASWLTSRAGAASRRTPENSLPVPGRLAVASIYAIMAILVIAFHGEAKAFVYFQF